ncbi:MAG TPA: aminomethyltransferase family protein, partial [Candidatus Dormibacteraeota bacterium]|nr:aminomethyltransferase family protein [Candidatus Dormibacteraeota bacterium]
FGPVHRDARYVAELARESYKYYYLLRYPFDSDEWGRPKRTSALHSRLQDLGAVFGVKHGWERPDYFEPGRPWRRAGPDQRAFGFARPPYLDRLADEHRAFRERAGIIDMSSFGKVEIRGAGALSLLERVAGNRIDRPVGSVIYTQLLEEGGGIAADVTITRLAPDHFRLVTGAGYVNSDLGWLRLQVKGEKVVIRESSDELSVIGMWGPQSRMVLQRVSDDDVSDTGFAFMQARDIKVAGFPVFAQRVTYVGELGWELYVDPSLAGQVWDRLMEAGRDFGITPGGYRVLDSLRMEKGYRYYGTDMGLLDTPFEAGLGFAVDREKWPGIERNVTRRLRTLAVGDEGYVAVYGGEAVLSDDRVVGRLRSCAYGFTVKRNLAYSYLPSELKPGAAVSVEVFGEMVPATVMQDRVLEPQPATPGARRAHDQR